jgi:hypothetical protein
VGSQPEADPLLRKLPPSAHFLCANQIAYRYISSKLLFTKYFK